VTEIDLDGRRLGCGVSRNASGTGLLLMMDRAVPVSSKLVLRIYLPGQEDARALAAYVVRCERIPVGERRVWGYKVGVQLEEPPEDFQQLVDSLSKQRR
jgi:hypothetical protein